MAGRTLTSFAVLLALVIAPGCGGGDGGSENPTAAVEKCLDGAGLDTRGKDVNSLDAELVADGVTHQFIALDVNQQEYTYEVAIFSAPEKAAAYAKKKQQEYDEIPALRFQVNSYGSNSATVSSDSPKREEVRACARDNG